MERSDKPQHDRRQAQRPACSDCYFHDTKIAPDKSIKILCRHDLPQLVHAWVPDAKGGMGILSQILWRVVEPDDWCGKFLSIDKMTN